MSWNKRDRFKTSSKDADTQTFSTLSEYLRQQFMVSNSLLSKAGDLRIETALESPKQKKRFKKSIRKPKPDVHDELDEYPTGSPAGINRVKRSVSMNKIHSPNGKLRVSPTKEDSPHSPVFGPAPPGPATYHQASSLAKHSFNRMLSDNSGLMRPESPQKYTGAPQMNSTVDEPRKEYKGNQNISTFAGATKGGAYLNKQKYLNRSRSAPPGGRSVYSLSLGTTRSVTPDWAVETVSDRSPALKHKRYPPLSDQYIRRWNSVQAQSYKPNHPRYPTGSQKCL